MILQSAREALDKLDSTCKKVLTDVESSGPEDMLFQTL